MKDIKEVLKSMKVEESDSYIMGKYKAKINYKEEFNKKAKIILVTAVNPTKYGEGKTTVAISLNDALKSLGANSILTLREPSMGPVFGVKGGATGGGKSVILEENDINLHFTADFHAITSANNLICACIDNEIYQGNSLDIQKVLFSRCMDMCDRALRNITINNNGVLRNEKFNITAASEIMACFCLSKNFDDLKTRIGDIIIGLNSKNEEIYVKDLGIVDAVLSLLMDAIKPNVVQTNNENPVIIHGGPFANIAHGCNSLYALNTASHYADYIVTEAGFGSDAGAFKFMDIVSRTNDIPPYVLVLVTTIRSLKYNGDGSLEKGICNLQAHIDNLSLMNKNIVVALNKFTTDTLEEIDYVKNYVCKQNIHFTVTDPYNEGYKSSIELANIILNNEFKDEQKYLYKLEDNLFDKIDSYVLNICHAKKCIYNEEVKEKIEKLNKYKYPICVAKTQYSISHDSKLLGYPKDYDVEIKDVEVSNGARFIKVFLGSILTMPGLNKTPNAKEIKIEGGKIKLPR